MVDAEPVEVSAILAAEVKQMLEAGGRDERRARALALEQRIRRNRRPVPERLDLVGPDRARRRENGVLLPLRGRHFRRPHVTVLEQDRVRKRPADVDAQDPHGLALVGVARKGLFGGQGLGSTGCTSRVRNLARHGQLLLEDTPLAVAESR